MLKNSHILATMLIGLSVWAAPAQRESIAVRALDTFLTVFRSDKGREQMMVSMFSSCLSGMRNTGTNRDFLKLDDKVSTFWVLGQAFKNRVDYDACNKILSKAITTTIPGSAERKSIVSSINLMVRQFNELYGPAKSPIESDPAYKAFRGMADDAIQATHGKTNMKAYNELATRFLQPATRKLLIDGATRYFAEVPNLISQKTDKPLPEIPARTMAEVPQVVEALIDGRPVPGVRSTARFRFFDGQKWQPGSLNDCLAKTPITGKKDCYLLAAKAMSEPGMEWGIDHLTEGEGPLGDAVRKVKQAKAEIYSGKGALPGTEADRFNNLVAKSAANVVEAKIPNLPEFDETRKTVPDRVETIVKDKTEGLKGNTVLDRGLSGKKKAGKTASGAILEIAKDKETRDSLARGLANFKLPGGATYDPAEISAAIAALIGLTPNSTDPTPVLYSVGKGPKRTLIQCLAAATKANRLPNSCIEGFIAAAPEAAARWAANHYPGDTDKLGEMLAQALKTAAPELGAGASGKTERERLQNFVRAAQHAMIDSAIGKAKPMLAKDDPRAAEALTQIGESLKTTTDQVQDQIFKQYLPGETMVEIGKAAAENGQTIIRAAAAQTNAALIRNEPLHNAMNELGSRFRVGPNGETFAPEPMKKGADYLLGVSSEKPEGIKSSNVFEYAPGRFGTYQDCAEYAEENPMAMELDACLQGALKNLGGLALELALKNYPQLFGKGKLINDALKHAADVAFAVEDGKFKIADERGRIAALLNEGQLYLVRDTRDKLVEAFKPKADDLRTWDTTPKRRVAAVQELTAEIERQLPDSTKMMLDKLDPSGKGGIKELGLGALTKPKGAPGDLPGKAAVLEHEIRLAEDPKIRADFARLVATAGLGPDLENKFVEAVNDPSKATDPYVADLAKRFSEAYKDSQPHSLTQYPEELKTKLLPQAAAKFSKPILDEILAQASCGPFYPGQPQRKKVGMYDCGCPTKGGQYAVPGGGLIFSDDAAQLVNLLRGAWSTRKVGGGQSCADSITKVIGGADEILAGEAGKKFFETPLAAIGQAIENSKSLNPPLINCIVAGTVNKLAGPAIQRTFKFSPTPFLDQELQEEKIHATIAQSPEIQKTMSSTLNRLQDFFNGKADRSKKNSGIDSIISDSVQGITASVLTSKPFNRAIASELMSNYLFKGMDVAAKRKTYGISWSDVDNLYKSPNGAALEQEGQAVTLGLSTHIVSIVGETLKATKERNLKLDKIEFNACENGERIEVVPSKKSRVAAAGQVQSVSCASDSTDIQRDHMVQTASELQKLTDQISSIGGELPSLSELPTDSDSRWVSTKKYFAVGKKLLGAGKKAAELGSIEYQLDGTYLKDLVAFRERAYNLVNPPKK